MIDALHSLGACPASGAAKGAPAAIAGQGAAPLRLLVPLKVAGDLAAVLPYLLSLADKASIRVLFLHVRPAGADAAGRADGECLLDSAARACAPHAIAHELLLVEGEVAFAILDTAESLACDQIVVPRTGGGGWRQLFVTPVVRQLQALGRDVPLLLIGHAGAAACAVEEAP